MAQMLLNVAQQQGISIPQQEYISRITRRGNSGSQQSTKKLCEYPFDTEKYSPILQPFQNIGVKPVPDVICVLIDTSGSTNNTGGRRSCRRRQPSTDQEVHDQQTKQSKCIILAEVEMCAHLLTMIANYCSFEKPTHLVINAFSSFTVNCLDRVNINAHDLYEIAHHLDQYVLVEFGSTDTASALDSVVIQPNGSHMIIFASDGMPNQIEDTWKSAKELFLEATSQQAILSFVSVGAGSIREMSGGDDFLYHMLPVSSQMIRAITNCSPTSNNWLVNNSGVRTPVMFTRTNSAAGYQECDIDFMKQLAGLVSNTGGAYIGAFGDYSEGLRQMSDFLIKYQPVWNCCGCPSYPKDINDQLTVAYRAKKHTMITIPNGIEYFIFFNFDTTNWRHVIGYQIALIPIRANPTQTPIDPETQELLSINIPVCNYVGLHNVSDDMEPRTITPSQHDYDVEILSPTGISMFYNVKKGSGGLLKCRAIIMT